MFKSAIIAPAPAALPADITFFKLQSGIIPSTMACFVDICAPNAPAKTILSTFLIFISSINNLDPANSAAFANCIALTSAFVIFILFSPLFLSSYNK